jgi:hypothetical protein
MARKHKRRMVFDPVTNVWRSATPPKDPTRARVLTSAHYEARVENGKKAAAAQKELHAYLKSDEWREIEAEQDARRKASEGQPMRKLPGQSWADYQMYVALNRNGLADRDRGRK